MPGALFPNSVRGLCWLLLSGPAAGNRRLFPGERLGGDRAASASALRDGSSMAVWRQILGLTGCRPRGKWRLRRGGRLRLQIAPAARCWLGVYAFAARTGGSLLFLNPIDRLPNRRYRLVLEAFLAGFAVPGDARRLFLRGVITALKCCTDGVCICRLAFHPSRLQIGFRAAAILDLLLTIVRHFRTDLAATVRGRVLDRQG